MSLIGRLGSGRLIDWKFVRRWYIRIGFLSSIVILVVSFAYSYSLDWTGFGDFTKPNNEFVRGKTLWDWMELVLIPLALFLGARYFTNIQRQTEIERADQKEQAEILQNYLDRMQDLILNYNLLNASSNESTAIMATILTRTTFQRLEAEKKSLALQFLDASKLVSATPVEMVIVSLAGISLRHVGSPTAYANGYFVKSDFSFADLAGIRFDITNFQYADFTGAHMEDAQLMYCDFSGANLQGAFLRGANLFNSKFSDQTIMPNGNKWHSGVNWENLGVEFKDPYSEDEYLEILDELDYER